MREKVTESVLKGYADLWKVLEHLSLYFPRLQYKYLLPQISLTESKPFPKYDKHSHLHILHTRTNFCLFEYPRIRCERCHIEDSNVSQTPSAGTSERLILS